MLFALMGSVGLANMLDDRPTTQRQMTPLPERPLRRVQEIPKEEDVSLRFSELRFIQCADCDRPIPPPCLDVRTLRCRHVLHRDCSICRVCDPPGFQFPDFIRSAFSAVFNVFGAIDGFAGRHRESIMMSTTFGLLWALGIFITPLRWTFGIDVSALTYVTIMTARFPFKHVPYMTELVAVCSCWIANRFGLEWNRGSILDFASSLFAALPCVILFRAVDEIGAVITFFYVFTCMWSWPNIWSLNLGNCCGVGTVAVLWGIVTTLVSVIVSSFSFKYFQGITVLHAWFVCGALFPKQTKDPFNRTVAEVVRSVSSFAALLFFVHAMRHNSS